MNVLEIQAIILNNTYTKSDFIRRVNFIREFLESRFYKENKKPFIDFLTENNGSTLDIDSIGNLDENFFNLFTSDNFYPLINSLSDSIKLIPVLTLYLPVTVDNVLQDDLCRWFRKNIHPELIMEVHCNPALVAGAAYVWNNQYHDLSLRYFFAKKEDLITKIVDSFSKARI